MTIQIKAPDGSIAQFPDGTPDATIEAVMARSFPAPQKDMGGGMADPHAVAALGVAPQAHVSPGADIGLSSLTGLNNAVANTVGMFGDAQNAGAQAGTWLATQFGKHVLGKDIPPATGPAIHPSLPTSADVHRAMAMIGVQPHTPQTTAGQYAKTIGEFAPAVLAPADSPTMAMLNAIVPGAASETGGQLTKGTKLEPYARVAGGLLGGLGMGAVGSVMSSPQRTLGSALGPVSDTDQQAAVQLMREAQARGVQITPAEAIQQVTQGAVPGATRMQRVIESTKPGRAALGPVMAERPGQTYSAVKALADAIAPETDAPSMIGVNAQEAATGILSALEKARTKAVTPLYQAAAQDRVPLDDMNGLMSDLDSQIATDKTGIVGGKLAQLRELLTETPPTAGQAAVAPERAANGAHFSMTDGSPAVAAQPRVPLTDLGNLDRVRKYVRDQLALPQIGQDAITKEQGGALTSILDRLDSLLENNSKNFAAGKARFADISQNVVKPATAGPLGAISQTDQVPAQTPALYPSNPLIGAPAETRTAVGALGQSGADLTRQHLLRTLNEAQQNLVGGANQFGGAKYAAVIAGNPEQGATLNAGLEAASPGSSAEHDTLLNVLRATGRREPAGSQTAFNAEELKKLSELPSANVTDPTKWPGVLRDAASKLHYNRNTKALADFLSADPDKAAAFLAAARRASPKGNLLANALIEARSGSQK